MTINEAGASVERYGPGEHATDLQPGDFILTHRPHLMARLISLAQKRRFRGGDSPYAHWSHCALVVDRAGTLVEAESRGVQRSPISKYGPREYHLVRLGNDLDEQGRRRATDYATAQLGRAFGYLVLVSESLWLLFGLRIRLARGDHQICSGLVTRALREGGLLSDLDPVFTLPADLARRFQARP